MPGRRRAVLAVALSTLSVVTVVSFGAPFSEAARSSRDIAIASVDNATQQGPDGVSAGSQLSGNGRYLVFTSVDPLGGIATGGHSNVFVRDLRTGHTAQLSLAGNLGPDGGQSNPSVPAGGSPNADSFLPSISANGREVSFVTAATDVVPLGYPADVAGHTVVVCDRDPSGRTDANGDLVMDGVRTGTTLPDYVCFGVTSAQDTSIRAIDTTARPRLSGNGTHIVWTQNGVDAAAPFHRDLLAQLTDLSGALRAPSDPVPVTNDVVGFEAGDQGAAVLDATGTVVTYLCVATFVEVIGFVSNSSTAVMRTDLTTGVSTRVDVDPANPGSYLGDAPLGSVNSSPPAMSDNGTEIAFTFHTTGNQVVVANVGAGGAVSTRFASLDNTGAAGPGQAPALSGDGRYLTFQTSAPNMSDAKYVNDAPQVVARDLVRDTTRIAAAQTPLPGALVSTSAATACGPTGDQECASDDSALASSLDTTGDEVAFDSAATDVVAGDLNNAPDAFVRTWRPTVRLAPSPVDFGVVQVGTVKTVPVVLTVGGFGPLHLQGGDVLTGNSYRAGDDNCYNVTLHETDGADPVTDPNSCTFQLEFAPTSTAVQTGTFTVRSPDAPGDLASVNLTGSGIRTAPRPIAVGTTVRTSITGPAPGTQVDGADSDQSMVSGNGRWDVFVSSGDLTHRDPTGHTKIFVRDLADPQQVVQISLAATIGTDPTAGVRPMVNSTSPTGVSPDGNSSHPNISADGRFVTFVTDATDVVPFRPPSEFDRDKGSSTVAVCDRDPSGRRDAQGNLVLDAPRPGTTVPDYLCFAVESGATLPKTIKLDPDARPRLSADGTRLTWTEDKDSSGAFVGVRVLVGTVSTRGGALHTPTGVGYVPSTIPELYDPPAVDTVGTDTASQDLPMLNADGTQVVFASSFGCCSAQITGIVVTDLATPLSASSSVRLDENSTGTGYLGTNNAGYVSEPSISATGARAAFTWYDGTDYRVAVVGRTPGTGTVTASSVVSLDNEGHLGNGYEPALSGDGRYLAFVSNSLDMHDGLDNDTGNCTSDGRTPTSCEVLVRDLVRDAARAGAGLARLPNELVSASLQPDCQPTVPPGVTCAGRGNSSNPSLDSIGSEIGFDSDANDLVAGDDNTVSDGNGGTVNASDAFVRTWRPTVTAAAVDFGSVLIGGAAARTVTVTVSGFGPIAAGQVVFTGPHPAEFSVLTSGCTGVVLHDPDTATCQLNVRFRPAAAGVRAATASVYTATNSYPRADPIVMVALRGVGVRVVRPPRPADVNAAPNPLGFGATPPLRTPGVSRTVTIVNTGGSTLAPPVFTVHDGVVPGTHGDYTVTPGTCAVPVPAGGLCHLTVTFVGHGTGDRGAVLVITAVAAHPVTSIALTATVPPPLLSVNPGVTPRGRVVTVRGSGFAPHHLVDIGFDAGPTVLQITTDAAGTFSRGMVVFANAGIGNVHVHGRVDGAVPVISAEAPLLIVLGTLESPKLVIRH